MKKVKQGQSEKKLESKKAPAETMQADVDYMSKEKVARTFQESFEKMQESLQYLADN